MKFFVFSSILFFTNISVAFETNFDILKNKFESLSKRAEYSDFNRPNLKCSHVKSTDPMNFIAKSPFFVAKGSDNGGPLFKTDEILIDSQRSIEYVDLYFNEFNETELIMGYVNPMYKTLIVLFRKHKDFIFFQRLLFAEKTIPRDLENMNPEFTYYGYCWPEEIEQFPQEIN